MSSSSKPFIDLGRGKSAGKTDISGMFTGDDQMAASVAQLAKEIDESRLEQMSPAGSLGLTEHLDAKRIEHGIIDDCFDVCASFNRILVYQLPLKEETVGKSKIIAPQASQKRMQQEAPTGVIVSAGLGALDVLRTHGMQVGDTILFIKQGMWRITTGWVRHVDEHLMVLSVGDIISNQDLAKRLREGSVNYSWDAENGEHRMVDSQGKVLTPKTPFVGADYE